MKSVNGPNFPVIHGMLVTSVSGTLHLPLTYLKTYNTNMNNKVAKGKVSTVSFSSSFFFSLQGD